MTANTTSTRELDINKIVERAHNLAGLRNPMQGQTGSGWTEHAAMARDYLDVIADHLQSKGFFVRAIDFYTLTLVASTSSYSLPSDTIDLIDKGAYRAPTDTTGTGETPLMPISRDQWQTLVNKGATASRPFLYYVDRHSVPVKVEIWPKPSEAGTVRFQRHRMLGDMNDGSKTVDLERHWVKYLLYELSAMLAESGGLDSRARSRRQVAERALIDSMRYSRQRAPGVIYNEHRSAWSR